MKKITDFIVDKKYFILSLFLILAGISIFLATKVKINYDITKYLPSTSETRIGMDIMENEFSSNTSSFNIMFTDLSEEEKENVLAFLESVEGVNSITYENTSFYNKDGYTMYVVNIDDSADSKTATQVFKTITERFEDLEIYTSGTVSDRNASVVSFWILGLAILCAMIILIIMCESYIEPFLFLFSIGIGVLLNKGTNIMFTNVSNITDSICAILQMALSMDYSIMLMNRYIQEKEKEPDKVKAMKTALYKSFSSISSSSVTTIVGLLALVFMSFTIGRDLGFVLAKGVLFSLLSIFTCLPALILLFDTLILKTKKKSPIFKLNKLGGTSYKTRYIAPILFILVFVASYSLKGNLGILYTSSEEDKIAEIFSENNQMAVVYKNEYESLVSEYCKELENTSKVDQVLCYGNTIHEPLSYEELNKKLNNLGVDTEIDDYLLKIIYYNYYNPEEKNIMTLADFLTFIKEEVYTNPEISKNIDASMKENISLLDNFVDESLINQKRDIKELALIFGIDEQQLNSLLVLYQSKNTNTKLTITEFMQFMNTVVLKDSTYATSIDESIKESLSQVSKFANQNTIQKKMSAEEMASLFGMNQEVIESLYTYYIVSNEIENKFSIANVVYFLNDSILNHPDYQNLFDESIRENMQVLTTFTNRETIIKEMSAKTLADLFLLDDSLVQQLLFLNYSHKDSGSTYTISNFVNSVLYLKNTTHYLDDIDTTIFESILNNEMLMEKEEKFTATEMATILDIPVDSLYNLYAILDYATGNMHSWTMSPSAFVTFILENQANPVFTSSLDSETLTNLNTLAFIMTSTINNEVYSYQNMAEVVKVEEQIMKNIYGLMLANMEKVSLSPQEFIDFVLVHQNDEVLAGQIDNQTLKDLQLLQKVMTSVIHNQKYSSKALSDFLGVDKGKLDMLYALYDVTVLHENVMISNNEFIDFLKNVVISNKEYASYFDEESISKINGIYTIIENSLSEKKYTKEELYNTLQNVTNQIDEDLIHLLYIYYGSVNNYDTSWNLTIEEVITYLNDTILNDSRFNSFLDREIKNKIIDSKDLVGEAKSMLVGQNYSRMIINTNFDLESEETFNFIKTIKDSLAKEDIYIIGDSPMAYEMNETFNDELNFITILTMIFIFVVVAFTFKSILIPIILVLLIQCAVYLTMGILSFSGGTVYFIALLIVQSILMGATIDYAILYTSYYLESRKTMNIKEAIINSYNKSIHTIVTSASILIIVTLIVGYFASQIAAKICKTISQGTLCSTLLILILLPGVLAAFDRFIVKKKNE